VRCAVRGFAGDRNVKTYGSRGQGQSGIDLIGRRDRDPLQPVAVQCKLKTKGDKLTQAEVRKETALALAVTPRLTEYYIATTASDDPALDRLALELSQEQAHLGRVIDIQIFGWETLQQKIRADRRALDAFDPGQSPSADLLIRTTSETLAVDRQILQQTTTLVEWMGQIGGALSPLDTARGSVLEAHLDRQIDGLRDLTQAGKPATAFDLLKALDTGLEPGVGCAVRARIRANMGIARLHLGDDEEGGRLLLEAYEINPSDPKVRANRILGLLLVGEAADAVAFAAEVMADDPTNVGAAAFLFEVAARVPGAPDPMLLAPSGLLNDRHVVYARISWLRLTREPEEWRALARQARAAYPDDDSIAQHYADALLDEVARSVAFARAIALAEGDKEKLVLARDVLAGLWAKARNSEVAGQPNALAIACNLATAHRGLNDRQAARMVIEDALRQASDDPDLRTNGAQLALDRRDARAAIRLLEGLPDDPVRILMLMNAWSHESRWEEIIGFGTPERRGQVAPDQVQMFDTMLYRARCAARAVDIADATAALLALWPDSLTARVVAADVLRHCGVEFAERAATVQIEALDLLGDATSYPDRLMLAQLMVFAEDFDGVIAALDGQVSLEEPSEPLLWLAWAFANGRARPRTHPFFASLPPSVIEQSAYARLAGAAEAARGDLGRAERHLRLALEAEPGDLRSRLMLHDVLVRDGKRAQADRLIADQKDDGQGDPGERMRLAHLLRRGGHADQALAIGFRAVMDAPDREDILASYPGLFFMSEALPASVAATRITTDVWFDLEGQDVVDVSGVIEDEPREGHYLPDHPLARLLTGRAVKDTIVLPSPGLGPDRTYTVREIKHKYVWLLHDVMQNHATRFPEATGVVEMTLKDGDIQPILEVARRHDAHARALVQAYVELNLPVSAIAAMSRASTIGFVERLPSIDVSLRTCEGGEPERLQAARGVRRARGKGAVLDTLTAWTAHHLGVLPALKAHFGYLVVPRSCIDELLEIRSEKEIGRGRESMTLSFDGEQPVRELIPADHGDRVITLIDAAIAAVSEHCEIAPNDGSDDPALDLEQVGWFNSGQILDPVHLARGRGLFLLSEDLRLRQMSGGAGGWLQIVLAHLEDEGAVSRDDFVRCIGRLAAGRHDHVWLDVRMLADLVTLDDPQADALFGAAIRYIGCRNAEIRSHRDVVRDFMQAVYTLAVPQWRRERACGRLLTELIKLRPDDYLQILTTIDLGFKRTTLAGRLASAYLRDWADGHFLPVPFLKDPGALRRRIRRAA
jgi:tetratricopeptide (TPR) repeat protein